MGMFSIYSSYFLFWVLEIVTEKKELKKGENKQ